jgi:hypothetical protein
MVIVDQRVGSASARVRQWEQTWERQVGETAFFLWAIDKMMQRSSAGREAIGELYILCVRL